MTQSEFRKQLDEITKNTIYSKQSTLIEKLNIQYPHSIMLVSNRFFVDTTRDCFKYVFEDKIPNNIWQIIEKEHQRNNETSETLISNLISKGSLELHDEKKENDRVVVYFQGDKPKHFGKIDKNVITSKWGNGHIWKHELWEVPLSYGDSIKYSAERVNCGMLKKVLKED